MSNFTPGTGSQLLSTNLPSAFFETARLLNVAENTRNASNTGIAAVANLSVSLSLDGGVASIAATIPFVPTLVNGVPTLTGKDYLGASFSVFNPGTLGDLKSTNIVAAFLEVSQLLSNSEKLVTPLESQPNNIQIVYDLETGSTTISANLPFSTANDTAGNISIVAIDYL